MITRDRISTTIGNEENSPKLMPVLKLKPMLIKELILIGFSIFHIRLLIMRLRTTRRVITMLKEATLP
jgi:hypothetical protein